MGKKDKKFDAPQGETQTLTEADVGTIHVGPESTDGAPPELADKVKAAPVRPTYHLVLSTPDLTGRVAYRFGKDKAMPKKAPRIPITLDGVPGEMAVTSSGGYSELVGYNGWLYNKDGDSGWILFSDGANPSDPAQFPDGIQFTTTEGLGPVNPLRLPKNPEGEANRRAAAAASALKRKAEKEAAVVEQAAAEQVTA